jgi:hypothetical protein
MTLKIEKPDIDFRSKFLELDKKTGVHGSRLLQAETPYQAQNLLGVGRRNLCINGGFEIWQRGSSHVKGSNGYSYDYAPDGWFVYFAGTYERSEDFIPTGKRVRTFKYTINQINGTERPNFSTIVENGAHLVGKGPVVLSWWQRASKDAPTGLRPRLYSANSGEFSGNYSVSTPAITNDYDVPITTQWEYRSKVLRPDSNMSNFDHLVIEMDGDSAHWQGNDWIEFANFQIETGDVATQFEYRSYGEYLRECQRYLWSPYLDPDYQVTQGNSSGGYMGVYNTTSRTIVHVQYPVTMYEKPSVVAVKTNPQMQCNVPFVAGSITGNFNSIEHVGQNSCVLNFDTMSSTSAVGTPISLAYLGMEFDAQI